MGLRVVVALRFFNLILGSAPGLGDEVWLYDMGWLERPPVSSRR